MYNRSTQLILNGTKEEVTAYIGELSARLRDISVKLIVIDPLPPIPGFMITIMGYIATQGLRIADWLKEPHLDSIDLIAHTTRSVFEACNIYTYLMADGGQHFMERLTNEMKRDELDLIKDSLSRFDAASAPAGLVARQKELEAECPPRNLKVWQLAEKAGAQSEYKTYYKTLSKYSHPTVYLLVGQRDHVYSQGPLRLLAERAVIYLEGAVKDYEELLAYMETGDKGE